MRRSSPLRAANAGCTRSIRPTHPRNTRGTTVTVKVTRYLIWGVIGGQMTGWTEQIAIVTGGSRGIGRAIARALAARGAAICINYATRAAEAEAAAAEIAAMGGRVIAIQADVADADAVTRMVARTEAELGPVSILVNNAGVSSPATLESYDPAAVGAHAARQCGWRDPHSPRRRTGDAGARLRPY